MKENVCEGKKILLFTQIHLSLNFQLSQHSYSTQHRQMMGEM